MKTYPLIVVLYDGMTNSVFASQVLEPLSARKLTHPKQPIRLITFETKKISREEIATMVPPEWGIEVTVMQRVPFFGMLSLYGAVYQLKPYLETVEYYEIMARGPLAGWVCMKALDAQRCTGLLVQARGLLAAEYAYVHAQQAKKLEHHWHELRKYQYHRLEKAVYGMQDCPVQLTIEAVSPALKSHLINTFGCKTQHMTIACDDIPALCSVNQVKEWRKTMRAQLNIAEDMHVYCYNGSAKAWQCPDQMVAFFKDKLAVHKNSFLMVLTQDVDVMSEMLKSAAIDAAHYMVQQIAHQDMYRYLAACDTGLLFRECNVVNWVSRPTKMLEYKAVGLAIEHNNTVACMMEEEVEQWDGAAKQMEKQAAQEQAG